MRILFPIAFFMCLAMSAQAEFHVPDREYRCPPSEHACRSLHGLSSFEGRKTPGYPFTINYVEFNDKGALWNPIELQDAGNQVKDAAGPNGENSVLLMIYIHGWENNADEVPGECQDACKFRTILMTRLADEQEKAKKPMKVVGIYLAWRGLTFTVEPFKHVFSYWPRRGVARHVGQTGMYSAIRQIEEEITPNRSKYIVVIAGHSFGARVLENAAETTDNLHTGFMKAYRAQVQSNAQLPSGQFSPKFALNPNLPADLILFVNAATSSTVSRATIKDIRATCAVDATNRICNADPLYVAVTSHADLATGIIMPIANFVFPAPSDHLRLISAANSPSLHTHEDPVAGCDADASVCFGVGPDLKVIKSLHFIAGRKQIPGSDKRPFWIFNVDKDVMSSHGDVWNPSVTDLVTHVILGNAKYQALQ